MDGRWTRGIDLTPSRRVFLGGIAGVALGGLLGGRAGGVIAAPATPVARTQKRLAKLSVLNAGLKWIEAQRDESGRYLDAGGEVPPGTTASIISLLIALRNVGIDVETDETVAHLAQADLSEYERNPLGNAGIAQVVMALVGAGADPRDANGVDRVAQLVAAWDAKAGFYGTYLIESAVVVMALAVADEPFEDQALATIAAAQLDDGSWAYDGGSAAGDAVTTAFVIQALAAAGRGDDATVARAVPSFRTVQAGETAAFGQGAFRSSPDAPPDANTTGLVVSALIAAGENPKAKKWGKAVAGLLAFQNESGAFRFTDFEPGDDLVSTVSALTALAGAYQPVVPAA
jgi:hypothetical protein